MVVRKILEATLVAGSTSVTFTDTDIPNSLLRVYCSRVALFPISQTLSGNSVTVNYKPQDSNIGVALEIVKSGLDIVDDLTTEDNTKALSANQGYVLKGLIDDIVIPTVPENITDLDDVDVTDISNGQVLSWDEDSNKFVNTTPGEGTYRESVLLENTNFSSASGTGNVSKSYTLNESLDNFDAVIVYAWTYNVNTQSDNNRANLVSRIIYKGDFYDVSISQGQSATNPFLIDGSNNAVRRSLVFQFTDATHITTMAVRTEAYVEPIIYKIVGIKY